MKWRLFTRLIVVSVAISITIYISYCPMIIYAGTDYDILSAIPSRVDYYIESIYDELCEIIVEKYADDDFSILVKDIIFERPYIVYNFQQSQDEVYYYPVMVRNNQIICIVGIIGLEDGYTFEVKDDMVDILNDMDYHNKDAVFYIIDNALHIETEDGRYTEDLSTEDILKLSDEERIFYYASFMEKKKKMFDKISYFTPHIDNAHGNLNAQMGRTISLYNKQVQYGYNMCWAAASATVINTLKHKIVTAFEICNRVGIGYDDGGTILDVQDALNYYGVKYNYLRQDKYLYWENIIDNIDSGYPLVLQLTSAYGNHAVTLYGYTTTTNNRLLEVWDSSKRNGSNEEGFTWTVNFNNTGAFRTTANGYVYSLGYALSCK